jgi:hypothetical protein
MGHRHRQGCYPRPSRRGILNLLHYSNFLIIFYRLLQTHAQIREWISSYVSVEVASAVRILYGGSVKASNAESLISCPNIDGFLVGGASLLPEFADVIKVTCLISRL